MQMETHTGTTESGSQAKEKWERPSPGHTKMNCDMAAHEDGTVGLGVIIRNHEGDVILAAKKETQAEGDTTILEGLAIRFGVQLAAQHGIKIHQVESDNLPIIQRLQGTEKPRPYEDIIIQDILKTRSKIGNPNFRHIRRTANNAAHVIARRSPFLSLGFVPDDIRSCIAQDIVP